MFVIAMGACIQGICRTVSEEIFVNHYQAADTALTKTLLSYGDRNECINTLSNGSTIFLYLVHFQGCSNELLVTSVVSLATCGQFNNFKSTVLICVQSAGIQHL